MTQEAAVQLLLGPVGLTVALLVIIYAAVKEWWVPGIAYRRALAEITRLIAVNAEIIRERDTAVEVALTSTASAKLLAEIERDRTQGGTQTQGAR